MPQPSKPSSMDNTLKQEMFATIAAKAPQGIVVLQGEHVVYANTKLAELMGIPIKEVLELKALDFFKFIADPDKADIKRRLKLAVKGEVKTKLYEFRIKTSKEEIRWLQVLPRLISVKEQPAILAMITDVTEQKRTEKAFQELVEHSLQGLIIIQDMKLVFSNQAFADISGYTIEELLNLSPQEVQENVHPDYQDRVWGRMRDRLKGKPVPSHYHFKIIRKDGEERWLEMYATVIQYNEKPAIQATFIDVTERQEADIKLQESEALYRGLFDELPLGLYKTTSEGRIIDANPALIELLGAKDKEALLEMNALDFYLNQDERKQYEEILGDKGMVIGHDVQFKRLDGKVIWVHDTYRAIRNEDGSIQYYEGSLEDITERKETEQALRGREKRYRALFERTHDAVFILSLDLKHLDANQRAAEMLGYKIDELVGMPTDKVVAPGEYEDSKRVLRRLLAGDQVPVYERIFVKKNGEEFPVEINAALVSDAEGNPLHIQSVARDITERKQAEYQLRESEEKYRTLIETSPDAITVTDLEGNLIMMNRQALKLYGADDDKEVIGLKAFDLIDPKDVPKAMENLQKTLQEGKSGALEYTLLRRDGTTYPAELNASLLKDAEGNPTAFIGVIRDISDRKEAEARYRHLFDSVPVGLYRTTPDGSILDVNPALVALLGFEKKEPLLERNASSFYIDPQARKQWEIAVAREEVVTGVQAEFRREDNEIIWVELSVRAIRGKDGKVEYYEGTLKDITARKRSEEALQESEAKYRALVDQSLQGIIIFQEGRIVFSNPQIQEIVDLSPEELHDLSLDALWELIQPVDREMVQQRLQDRLAGKRVPDRYEVRARLKDGSPIWIEIWVKQIEYQGNPALQVTLIDVTERKRADQALKESEEKYRHLVEQSLYGLVISQGAPPRIYFANEAFAAMIGYSSNEILAMSPKKVQDLIHPGDQELIMQRVEDRLAGKPVPQQYEYRMIRKDGTTLWVEIFANLIEYEGEPAIQAAYMDITERKEAEAALQESEEKFRALVEELSDWVWELDLKGTIIYTNNAVEDILGFSAGQVLGRTPCDFLRPEDIERARQTFAELIEKKRPIRTLVVQFLHRDGSDVVLEARGRPVIDEEGVLLGFRGICRDITDRLKMLEQLRVLDERL